jgi:ubiquinone/menaquinone biosynthesis C-methylase UbiE
MNSSSTTEQNDALRAGLLGMWSSVSNGWEANADFIDLRSAALTERMISETKPRPGESVLELACGPGGPGFAASPLVGTDGKVVVSDFSPEMTAIAARRATDRELGNVSARVLDLENIDAADDSFDVVLCREGLMLVPDPDRAAREICRVLRPGGRASIAVWGPRANNPWLSVVFDVVSAQLGAPVPPPGLPQPFSLDDADRFHTILTDAGLDDVEVATAPSPYKAASVEEWWNRTLALAGPLANVVATLPPEAKEELRARAEEAIGEYVSADGLNVPGETLLASARVRR